MGYPSQHANIRLLVIQLENGLTGTKRMDLREKKKALKVLKFINTKTSLILATNIRRGGTWFAYARTWQSDVEAFHKLVRGIKRR